MALNVTWMDKIRNEDLYGKLPRIAEEIRERRLRLVGHCVRHSELKVGNLVLWEPVQGKSNRGHQRLSYVDQLRRDTSLNSAAELRTVMSDRSAWRTMTRGNSK